jgi:hypothetical protein
MSYICSIHGPKNSGKSTLAARIPGKSAWLDLEFGALRALANLDRKDQLRHKVWRPKDKETQDLLVEIMTKERGDKLEGRRELWGIVMKAYADFLVDPDIDNIIFDTWKMSWNMNTMFHLQATQEDAVKSGKKPRSNLIQIEYGPPNARQNGIITGASAMGKNLILISHDRDKYERRFIDGKWEEGPTGERELDGFNATLNNADWAFSSEFIQPCPKSEQHKCPGYHFEFTVVKAGMQIEKLGIKIGGDTVLKLLDQDKQKGENLAVRFA